jgi:hypothetical protein
MAARIEDRPEVLQELSRRLNGKIVTRKRPFRSRLAFGQPMSVYLWLFGGPPSVVGRINGRVVMVQFRRGDTLWVDLVYSGSHRLELPGDTAENDVLARPDVQKHLADLEPYRRLSVTYLLIEHDADYNPATVTAEEIVARLETLDALAMLLEE